MKEDTAQIEHQLEEAKSILANQRLLEKKGFRYDLLLRSGQYVAGGILVTGLFHIDFAPTIIGLLGLLVLISTFVHHISYPDVKRISATAQISKLQRLIRTAEANLAEQALEEKSAVDMPSLTRYAADTLDEIQRSIHLDYALIRRSTSWYRRPSSAGK